MGGLGNMRSFDSVKVNLPVEQVRQWAEARREAMVGWIVKKEKTLAEKMKDTKLTAATLESLLSGGGYGNATSNARGGVESHEQAQLAALVRRITELKDSVKYLSNVIVGLKVTSDKTIELTLSSVTSLSPADPGAPDENEE